ncbi:MAG: hypothetical protein AAF409_11495 [Pseudomonadota bacterium]
MSRAPYFAIFAAMRTGSNLLERTLAELGDTTCYGEAFNPAFIGGPRCHYMMGWNLARRNADPLGFLTQLRAAAEGSIPGFRVFDGHGRVLMTHALADPMCRKVVLRRDPLESYLSLKIARQTGQWMLKNPRRRIAARVQFDASEYADYTSGLEAHYAWIDAQLTAAGETAVRVDYAELQEHAKLAEIARYIGSAGTLPEHQPIARQNPQNLAEKVSNYKYMCETLDISPGALPTPKPRSVPAIRLAPSAQLACAEIPGPAFEVAISLLYRFERRSYGGRSLSYTQLQRESREGTYAPRWSGEETADGRVVFAITSHPAIRIVGLFNAALFGPDRRVSPVRQHFLSRYRALPEASADMSPEDLAQLLAEYLDMVSSARHGSGAVFMDDCWREQSILLDACQAQASVDRVADIDDLDDLVGWLAARLNVPALPPSHIADVLRRALPQDLPAGAFMTDEIGRRLSALYSADFVRFAYPLWPRAWTDAAAR